MPSCEYGAQATSGMLRRVRISLDGAPSKAPAAQNGTAALGCAARPAEPGQHLLRQRRAEIRAERVWPARGATRPDTPQLPASATASHRAIADFMGALATRSDALEPDLRRLFSALQDAPEFALFRNASPYRQHDAADFAEGLIAAMDLDNQPSHRLRLCRIPGAGLPTEPYGLPTSLVNVRLERHDGGLDLQSILNKSLSDMPAHSGEAGPSCAHGLAARNINELQGFNLRIGFPVGMADLAATRIRYDGTVSLRIMDLEVEQEYLVTLEPVAVVMHAGVAGADPLDDAANGRPLLDVPQDSRRLGAPRR